MSRSLYQSMLGGDGEDGELLGQLLEGMLTSQVTTALARLGVPDLLAAGPRSAAELAADAGADADAMARLLAAASCYALVTQLADGAFTLTGAGALLRSDAPGSARAMAIGFHGEPMWLAASRTADVVRGHGADPAAPGGLYEWYGAHPQEAVWFARAMSRATSIMLAELAASGFRPLTAGRIVDVGGSRGGLLAHLLTLDPQAVGVLFDRAEALAEAPGFFAGAGLADRAEIVAGDFLREVPAGDLHVISQVLHNWDDDHVRVILGNCRRASRPGGSILIIEYLLPETPGPSLAHLMDLAMLTILGGRERTRAQHEALLAEAGYTLVRDTALDEVMPWHILEFRRGATG